ncbi:MAG: DUF4960 domain-containing protein [Paludibacteraceae bacterium]|nr:DUF4960 domain-containing protein [Paludibacteraceae bacterium]
MKTTKIICAFSALLAALIFTSCEGRKDVLSLDGDCDIISLTLDEKYTADIDLLKRTLVVPIPETYDEQDMKITAITLSEGASASVKVGDHLNMVAPKVIRVTNKDVFQEFALSVRHDEARILSFVLNGQYMGVINQAARTISAQVAAGTDLKSLIPTVTTTDGATLTPANGMPCDFTQPVDFTVTYNTASCTYKVTVTELEAPHIIYVGAAATMQQLGPEEQTACAWLLANVEKSVYASFADLASGAVDMSQCKVIWWHLHKDGGIDGKGPFEENAAEALAAVETLKSYYAKGGNFLLTRYATYLPAYIGENVDCVPNNCWGQNEDDAETVGGPWGFNIAGHTDHPMWQDLLMKGDEPQTIFTCDAGYRITNSTAQYHIGTDWGGYADNEDWRNKTGAVDIAYGDNAIVAWEYLANDAHGHIVCIGSGTYDWYTVAEGVAEYYHANVAKMTENAINYLMK